MRLKQLFVCVSSALVLLSGCGTPASTPESKAAPAAAPASAGTPVDVQTAEAEQRQVSLVVRATGTFIPDESSDVTPQVAGTIVQTMAQVGDVVKAGAVIVKLDDRDARIRLNQVQASLQQAEAEAARARQELQRNADLAKSGDISRSSFDRLTSQVAIADAAVAQVKAQMAAAEKAVDDTVIRAPFSGHVSARPSSVGEYVTTSVKLLTLVRIQPIKLNLQVPESDAARLRRGMSVEVAVPAHEGAVFKGTVGALNVAIDPNSRAMTVEAHFPNADSKLTPGMFGSAEVRLPATESAVFVPTAAVARLANGDASVIYIIEGGQAHVQVVQVADELNGMRRVISGVAAGAAVATTALDKLFDGAPVKVTSHAQAR
ncbi:MAG: efflux RND transporter periplasmic adaptor subunit [Vicinamibacterales bacterium]